MSEFTTRLAALSSAEEFFTFLDVAYDPAVVRVKRLHILKRFNERLASLEIGGMDDEALRAAHSAALTSAYEEFITREARDAKLFKVFQQGRAFVPLSDIGR